MADFDICKLRELLAFSTKGEWYVEEDDDVWELYAENAHPEWACALNPRGLVHPMKIAKCPKRGSPYAEYWPNKADAELIVAAINALPALLDEIERLRSG